jgi:hypothetical protein
LLTTTAFAAFRGTASDGLLVFRLDGNLLERLVLRVVARDLEL